tara:strand:+ start:2677 stop:3021 length:345 start_codon:yes stop_codon:yes gene_type:complete
MIRGIKLLVALIFIGTFATTQASILDSIRPYESSEQKPQDFQSLEKHMKERIKTYRQLGMPDEMINDEMEKFERFKQKYLLEEIESLTSQDGQIKLPSRSIRQENFGSIDRRIK